MAENGAGAIPEVGNGAPPPAQKNIASKGPSSAGLPKGTSLDSNGLGHLLIRAALTDAAKDRMCRNLYIYGFCRYEGKGCAFRHDRVRTATAPH
jgi:hypothetical protein